MTACPAAAAPGAGTSPKAIHPPAAVGRNHPVSLSMSIGRAAAAWPVREALRGAGCVEHRDKGRGRRTGRSGTALYLWLPLDHEAVLLAVVSHEDDVAVGGPDEAGQPQRVVRAGGGRLHGRHLVRLDAAQLRRRVEHADAAQQGRVHLQRQPRGTPVAPQHQRGTHLVPTALPCPPTPAVISAR